MNIRNVGHSMKYEAECVAMLFFRMKNSYRPI